MSEIVTTLPLLSDLCKVSGFRAGASARRLRRRLVGAGDADRGLAVEFFAWAAAHFPRCPCRCVGPRRGLAADRSSGELPRNIWVSFLRAVAGLVVGGGIGFAFGLANGLSRLSDR